MTVAGVTLGGRPVSYSHATSRLRVPVPEGAAPGQDLIYTITYAGIPLTACARSPPCTAIESVFSDNWPDHARHWLPLIDHPTTRRRRADRHRAGAVSGRLQWRARRGDRSAATVCGERTGSSRCRSRRGSTPWRGAIRRPPRRTCPARPAADLGVSAGSRRGSRIFEETSRRAMDFFSDRVGPYPYEKLANVQAAGIGGGMENATAIFYGEKSVAAGRAPGRARDRASVVRQFGYRARLGRRVAERGFRDLLRAAVHRTVRGSRRVRCRASRRVAPTSWRSRRSCPTRRSSIAISRDMDRVLNQFVYQKGGWVLHMLRAGDRHGSVLDRHPRLLPALSRSKRIDRRFPAGDGAGQRAKT